MAKAKRKDLVERLEAAKGQDEEIILLCKEGWTRRAVAQVIGVSEGAVYRALKKYREKVAA